MRNDKAAVDVARSALIVLLASRALGGNSTPVQQLVASLPAVVVTAIVLSFAEMHEDDLKSFVEGNDD